MDIITLPQIMATNVVTEHLNMFGFKEMGIDVKEAVGSFVENKTGKFNTPGT